MQCTQAWSLQRARFDASNIVAKSIVFPSNDIVSFKNDEGIRQPLLVFKLYFIFIKILNYPQLAWF